MKLSCYRIFKLLLIGLLTFGLCACGAPDFQNT